MDHAKGVMTTFVIFYCCIYRVIDINAHTKFQLAIAKIYLYKNLNLSLAVSHMYRPKSKVNGSWTLKYTTWYFNSAADINLHTNIQLGTDKGTLKLLPESYRMDRNTHIENPKTLCFQHHADDRGMKIISLSLMQNIDLIHLHK